jgi:hypothetical protein
MALRVSRKLDTQNVGHSAETRPTPAPARAPVIRAEELKGGELAPCGSSDCAGCYDVGDGKRIHPPKIGDEYRNWLLRWEGNGKIQ